MRIDLNYPNLDVISPITKFMREFSVSKQIAKCCHKTRKKSKIQRKMKKKKNQNSKGTNCVERLKGISFKNVKYSLEKRDKA